MTDEEMLAEMRRHYEYATLESHILVDGVLYGRCNLCHERPIPHTAHHVMLCDACLDEYLANEETVGPTEFVRRKREQYRKQQEAKA